MKKMNPLLPVALVLAVVSPQVLAKDVTVMISGGFKAALEKLAPQFEAASGDSIILVSGPSMGKTPQAIPARLARGERADVVIMVGEALDNLQKRTGYSVVRAWSSPTRRLAWWSSKALLNPGLKRRRSCAIRSCMLNPLRILIAPAAAMSAASFSKNWVSKSR